MLLPRHCLFFAYSGFSDGIYLSHFTICDRARSLIRLYGADRVLFGSDFPMWDPALELTLLARVGLTDDERERVLWRNARELLGL